MNHYFDHNATTALDPRVLEAMLPYLAGGANASSRHTKGVQARNAIEQAREQIAKAVNAKPSQVIFTSGGSEANNLFIRGAAACLDAGVFAISDLEHACVRLPVQHLQSCGWQIEKLPVDAHGHVDLMQAQQKMIERSPKLASILLAHNECGAVQNIPALALLTAEQGGWLHTDAVQAFGKIAVDFSALGVQALTVSSHKIGGPMGAGALVVDDRVTLAAQIVGGGQERALRAGTENVAAIVGFGLASELVTQELAQYSAKMRQLQQSFEAALAQIGGCVLFGGAAPRLPNTSFFAFEGIRADRLVAALDEQGFAIASGAACSSANAQPSSALLAMGVPTELARGAVRVSFGRSNEHKDIHALLQALQQAVRQIH